MAPPITYKKLDQLQRAIDKHISKGEAVFLQTTEGTTIALLPYSAGAHSADVAVAAPDGSTSHRRIRTSRLAWVSDPAMATDGYGPFGMMVRVKDITNDGRTMLFTDVTSGRHLFHGISGMSSDRWGPIAKEWDEEVRSYIRNPVELDVPAGHSMHLRTCNDQVLTLARDVEGTLTLKSSEKSMIGAHPFGPKVIHRAGIDADHHLEIEYGTDPLLCGRIVEYSPATPANGKFTHPLGRHAEAKYSALATQQQWGALKGDLHWDNMRDGFPIR